MSGGGVLIDMGYHYIDILLWFFGMPDGIYSSISDKNLKHQNYNTEDTIKIICEYNNKAFQHTIIFMNISRTYPIKQENITFLGGAGYMVLEKDSLKIFDLNNKLLEEYNKDLNENIYKKQINYFVDLVINNKKGGKYDYLGSAKNHLIHMELIEKIYQQNK